MGGTTDVVAAIGFDDYFMGGIESLKGESYMSEWIIGSIIICCIYGTVYFKNFKKKEEIKNILHTKELESLVAVCIMICIILGTTITTYRFGHLIARQYEMTSGITENQYRTNKWKYRAVLTGLTFMGGTGITIAVAFDDYFTGI